MKKPSDKDVKNIYNGILKFEDIPCQTYYGYEMRNCLHHGGETTWTFPTGICEKILNDKMYRVGIYVAILLTHMTQVFII